MQIAINTGSLSQDTPEALQMAADLGFRQVEVNLQTAEFDYGYRRKPNARFYRRLKQLIDDLGLSVWSVTSPPQTQAQMFSVRARKDILMNGVGAAGLLGAQVYVTSPADLFENEDDLVAYFDDGDAPPTIKGFDEAWAQIINRRMSPVIRNYDYWMGAPLINQSGRMKKVTEDLAIGCALDIRLAQHRNPLPDWIEQVGDRLAVGYVYDVDENGRPALPAATEWTEWLPVIGRTRLKSLVISAGEGQGEADIEASRTMLQDILEQ